MSRDAGFTGDAPVVLRLEYETARSPEAIWGLLTEPDRWPLWFRRIRFASLRGPLVPGSALIWQIDDFRVSSLILEVEENRNLGLTLRMMGGRGGMRWTLEPLAAGGTLIVFEESWSGILVWLLRRTLRRTIEGSRREWLNAFEGEAGR